MTDVWHRALSPQRHVVLGLELQPLTLGHVRLLAKLDSALLSSDRDATLQDVITAALVCSQPWRESERDLAKGWRFNLVMAYWGWRCRRLVRDGMLSVHSKLLDSYLADNLEVPEFTPKGEGKMVDRVAPWHWRLLVVLMTQFHMTEAEALDTPISCANLLWVAKGEMEDVLTIASDVDGDFWEWARRQDEARAKEAAN